MKKHWRSISILCVITVLLSGCGNSVENLTSQSVTSGNAVSGEAVLFDETKKGADSSLENHTYCSKNCLYLADDEKDELIQISVRTNKKKTFEVPGLLSILRVENDRIFYTKSFWNGDDDVDYEDRYWICHMPIVSDGEGAEKPVVGKEERLEDIPGCSYDNRHPCMDEDSVYYVPYDASGKLLCYDWKRKKKETVPVKPYFYGNIYRFGGKVYFVTNRSEEAFVEVWNRGTDQVTRIDLPEPEGEDLERTVIAGRDAVYYSWYPEGDKKRIELRQMDLSAQQAASFVTEEEIKNLLSGEAGIREDAIRNCDMDLDIVGERLYLTLSLEWTEGSCWHIQDVILSRGLRQGDTLQYEPGLSECMQKYGKKEQGGLKKFRNYLYYDRAKSEKGITEIQYNTGKFQSLGEEKAYLRQDADDVEGERYRLFDCRTGKSKLVEKGMPEYYEYYYDHLWTDDYCG